MRVVGDRTGGQAQGLDMSISVARRSRLAMLARFMKGSSPVITISLMAGYPGRAARPP